MDHDIFRTPNRVEPTLEDRPTPSSYAHYPDGRDLGETMSMWRVQTEGYTEGKGQLIGIVSRDAGFLDSPDVEWISGGVNSKGPNAVAIGRHGNFFHWGFAASPTYLTDEAKLVLVNALHYIARFDGQTPIARKVSGVMQRSNVEGMIDGISDEGYAGVLARYAGIRESSEKQKREIQERIDDGEEVSEMERSILGSRPVQDPGRFDRVKGFIDADVWDDLDEDPDRIAAYLRENLPYYHPTGDWYELGVDEELKSLGVPNHDVALLGRAIECLAGDERADLARTLLERYTNESFETPAEWASWLEDNRALLFFSESAGYKWLVDRRAPRPSPKRRPSAGEPIVLDATLDDLGDGRHALTVHAEVLEGWHAYASVPKGAPYTRMDLRLELPEGLVAEGDWSRPAARPAASDPMLALLEGEFSFRRVLVASRDLATPTDVVCKASYQVCNDEMCFPPTTDELKVTVER